MAKVRKLVFPTENSDGHTKFMILYQGFMIGGALHDPRESKGMNIIRMEGRILDKIDVISDSYIPPGGRLEEETRKLKPSEEPWALPLEQPECELVKKYVERAPWTPRVARDVINFIDWMETIPLE